VTLFPWLLVLLLMALIAELIIVGPRATRSLMRGEGMHFEPASLKMLLALVIVQIVLVVIWVLLLRQAPAA
jgi:hypothetical protein